MQAALIPKTVNQRAIRLIAPHQSELTALCHKFCVQRLELFGSALGKAFDPVHSDLDFLVEFAPLAPSDYASAFFGFKDALEKLLGRPADLVIPSAIRNPYFRQSVENGKALLYAA